MLDNKDYMARLNRARRRRRKGPDIRIILAAAGIILLAALAAGGVYYFRTRPEVPAAADSRDSQQQEEEAALEAQAQAAAEEAAAEQQEQEIQAVLDSYENLGLVQVSGYLNIRETPASDGRIIGKLLGDSACEILGQEGDWYHITSGGIEGYISSQYVLTGDEAIQAARPNVKLRAIVKADKLNIRSEPVLDPSNVIGQVLENERYEVISQVDGWVEIPSGYVSADYVDVQYALNEARELDLVTMALSQYDNLVISKVNNYLNVRAEPSTDGEIIGKMTSKAAGEILETLDGWYKIKSGNITGYITADTQYTATGQEARDLAVSTASLMAIVNTDRLNVRTEPSTDATIWTQISKEERYPVISQLDGWVQIELDSDDGDGEADLAYISTRDNNVEVRYALPEAIKFSPLEEAAQESASLRTRIVNYALQFVGNPYVWGGTSLTNGVDCSGFTMQVMRNFGISLPHYSGSQARMGKSVSSSEMRPGDLIFYANSSGTVNHVAMYIGNGQIVHAASRRSGIKISTWNYRTPKTIRNVLGD